MIYNYKYKNILVISALDPTSNAGLQADVKTINMENIYAASIASAITVQNSVGFYKIYKIDAEVICEQIKNIAKDVKIDFIKIGALCFQETIDVVYEQVTKYFTKAKIILDPVLAASVGGSLLEKDGVAALKKLISISYLVTPNISEIKVLSGDSDIMQAAQDLLKIGTKNILLKSAAIDDENKYVTDLLITKNGQINKFTSEVSLKHSHIHGTGCILSSLIAANLAKNQDLLTSISKSKEELLRKSKMARKIGKGKSLFIF